MEVYAGGLKLFRVVVINWSSWLVVVISMVSMISQDSSTCWGSQEEYKSVLDQCLASIGPFKGGGVSVECQGKIFCSFGCRLENHSIECHLGIITIFHFSVFCKVPVGVECRGEFWVLVLGIFCLNVGCQMKNFGNVGYRALSTSAIYYKISLLSQEPGRVYNLYVID